MASDANKIEAYDRIYAAVQKSQRNPDIDAAVDEFAERTLRIILDAEGVDHSDIV